MEEIETILKPDFRNTEKRGDGKFTIQKSGTEEDWLIERTENPELLSRLIRLDHINLIECGGFKIKGGNSYILYKEGNGKQLSSLSSSESENFFSEIIFQLLCLQWFLNLADLTLKRIYPEDFTLKEGTLTLNSPLKIGLMEKKSKKVDFVSFLEEVFDKPAKERKNVSEKTIRLLERAEEINCFSLNNLSEIISDSVTEKYKFSLTGNIYKSRDFVSDLFERFSKTNTDGESIFFQGKLGCGKTALLSFLKDGFRLIGMPAFYLDMNRTLNIPFSGVKRIFERFSNRELSTSGKDKNSLNKYYKNELQNIIEDYPGNTIFLIDNTDQMDAESYKLLKTLTEDSSLLMHGAFESFPPFISSSSKSFEIKHLTRNEIESAFPIGFHNPELREKLWERSNGNPYIYRKYLSSSFDRISVSDLMLPSVKKTLPELPTSLDDYFHSVIDSLSEEEYSLLKMGFVRPSGFTLSEISALLQDAPAEELCEKLVEKDILEKHDKKYSFAKKGLKNFIYKTLNDQQRKEIHNLTANLLEDKLPAFELYNHFQEAQQEEKTRKYALKAVKQLKQDFAYDQAIDVLDELEEIKDSTPELDILKQRLHLLLKSGRYDRCREECEKLLAEKEDYEIKLTLGRALKELGSYDRSIKLLEKVSSVPENRQTSHYNLIGLNYWLKGNNEKALQNYTKALDKNENENSPEFGITLGNIGILKVYLGEIEKAKEKLRRAIIILKNNDRLSEYILNLSRYAKLLKTKGERGKSETLYERTFQLYKDIGDISSACDELVSLGCIQRERGNLTKASESFRKVFYLTGQREDIPALPLAEFNQALIDLERGNWESARKIFKEHLERDIERGQKLGEAIDWTYLGDIEACRENFSEAVLNYDKAEQIFNELDNYNWQINLALHRTKMDLRLNNLSKAGKRLEFSMNLMKEKNVSLHENKAVLLRAEYFIEKDNIEKAKSILKTISDHLKERDRPHFLRLKGIIKYRQNKKTESKQDFREALNHSLTSQCPLLGSDILADFLDCFPEKRKDSSLEETLKKTIGFCRERNLKSRLSELNRDISPETPYSKISKLISRVKSCIHENPSKLINLLEEHIEFHRAVFVFFSRKGNPIPRAFSSNFQRQNGFLSKIADYLLREKKSLYTDTKRDENPVANHISTLLENTRYIALEPVMKKDSIKGFIYLDRNFNSPFSSYESSFHHLIARIIGLAVDEKKVSEPEDSKETSLQSFENMIGKSPKMQKVFDLLKQASQQNIPVLIQGETGTGKELAAKALHNRSERSDNPFLAVNCSALPENLLESELFGHKKGSFSGANEDRKGLIEEADGGTFFLDEIADMPMRLQSKLLRVLQEGKVRRVGASEKTDVMSDLFQQQTKIFGAR